MIRFLSMRGLSAALVAVIGFSPPPTGSMVSAFTPDYVAVAITPSLELTPRDVAASNAKVRMAHAALITMWGADFREIGERFAAPDLVPYYGGVQSACGILRASNALYCPRDNTIYFDEVFVAAQAKSAALELGTDGDMAAVGVIAHEMGHAVAMQLGHISRVSYQNEATADCLAGAFAQQASHDGSLEDGDVDEAFYAMSSAGDPTPELTGDSRTDRWILARAARRGHGTREQRMQNFKTGLDGGAGACLAEFKNLPLL
jgi:predicted metalloprotease